MYILFQIFYIDTCAVMVMLIMQGFPIVLHSGLSKSEYPSNQGGDFVNVLNTSLEFKQPWSVALSEVSYMPDSWYNVRIKQNSIDLSIEDFDVNVVKKVVVYAKDFEFFYDDPEKMKGRLERVDDGQLSVLTWYGSYKDVMVYKTADYSTVVITGKNTNLDNWVKSDINFIDLEVYNIQTTMKYGEQEITAPAIVRFANILKQGNTENYKIEYYVGDELKHFDVEKGNEYKVTSDIDHETRNMILKNLSNPRNNQNLQVRFKYNPLRMIKTVFVPPAHYPTTTIFLETIKNTINNGIRDMLEEANATTETKKNMLLVKHV